MDAQHHEVTAWRCECHQYGHVFRVYPKGVNQRQISKRVNGMVLSIDELPGEDAEQLKSWLEPILDAVDADVVVSDDADAFKNVSDVTGSSQQVCKSRVVRNAEALVDELSAMIGAGHDHSLEAIHIAPEQALEDLAALKEMIHSRHPEDQSLLEGIYLRYANAHKPGGQET